MVADWNWNKPQVNLKNAQVLGKAAKLAYQDPPKLQNELLGMNMKMAKFFNCNSTQAYLAKNDKTCILSFRGTQPTKIYDWLVDLDCVFVDGPAGKGKIHRGFRNALDDVWDDILLTLKKERGTRSLWITGHSLGGALAVLATARLQLGGIGSVNGLYTYGQPRVGDPEFCGHFNQLFGNSTFRIVNFQDIVPRVPLRNMGYEHQGKFFFFNENKYDPDMTWDKVLLRKVGNTIKEIADTKDFTDHYMDNYVLKLDTLANFKTRHDQ